MYSSFVNRTSSKPESPVWSIEKEFKDKESICKHVNGKNMDINLTLGMVCGSARVIFGYSAIPRKPWTFQVNPNFNHIGSVVVA